MNYTKLNGQAMYEMLANGYRNLCRMEHAVNDLNVFPVPDGDTGSNMVMTLGGGVLSVSSPVENISDFMEAFSRSVLLSARGNSGVILSQFIQGLANGVSGKDSLLPCDVYAMMTEGVNCAYKAVIKPTEGTVLTVVREASEALENYTDDSFISLFEYILEQMKISLRKTPELLPVLKEAGVVDSGGVGMVYIFEGMLAFLKDERIDFNSSREDTAFSPLNSTFGPDSTLEYGYCTEFILQLMNSKISVPDFDVKVLIDFLQTIGDSIVCVQDKDIVKVHVHTFTPEKVLEFARNYGEFVTIKIENMSVQHSENTPLAEKRIKKPIAVVAVASGEGLSEYFLSIGADKIVNGGQTQNPSIREFFDAFDEIDSEDIVVLPNNSNIILTANQAAEMYEKTRIHVIPTKSMAEGYSALSMINPDALTAEEFVENMSANLPYVTTGCVSKAIHDANMNGVNVTEGEYIGIVNGKIVCSCASRQEAAIELLKKVDDIEDKEVITVFYGAECSEEEANAFADSVSESFPLIECGVICGGQAVYDYYMAIE